MNPILKIARIDAQSITPKYLQLTDSILQGIQAGQIRKNDILPSINEFSYNLETARSTVERAYNELKRMGIVKSVAGKGFFILHTQFNRPVKILLLFNKLSIPKKMIYDVFAGNLGDQAAIDFYIYNNDFNLFKKLLSEKAAHYAKVVIIPHFKEDKELGYALINSLPKEKLILMDKLVDNITGEFGAVYEDFEADIYFALEQLKEKLSHYEELKIIFPQHTYYSRKILYGFLRFCQQYGFQNQILTCLKNEKIQPGTVYINLAEDDLVILIEKVLESKLQLGKDIGVISYNETPLKRVILDGITTISTDFKLMGEKAAELVLQHSVAHIKIPFQVKLRNSI